MRTARLVTICRIVCADQREYAAQLRFASSSSCGSEHGVRRPWAFCVRRVSGSGTTVLANLSYDERDVVLLFAWIELANVSDNRVN